MQLFRVSGILLSIAATSCGGGSSCDEKTENSSDASCVASTEATGLPKVGDFCSTDREWIAAEDGDVTVALRCTNATLGERKADRLKCQRSGYEISITDDALYAYCVNNARSYSFLYDVSYGSYKPWYCSEESGSKTVGAVDSSGKNVTLACVDNLYRPQTTSTSDETSSSTNSGMCESKSKTESDVFAVFSVRDFDPEEDQVEDFDPSAYCDGPTDNEASPADNVSGSFLGQPR